MSDLDPKILPASTPAGPIVRGSDRRGHPTPRISRWSLGQGRRRASRRDGEREGSFVDRYSRRLWLLILWVAIMNMADSFFTIIHLQNGGIELNPIAAALLESGRTGFVIWKSSLIAVPLLVLCVHKNFVLARVGILAAAATYTALCVYHISLF